MRLDTLYSAWNTNQDADTLNELILAVRDRGRSWFRRFGSDAEDMAQDLAILVLGKLPTFVPASDASFSHWLSAIVRRMTLKRYSRRKHISSDDLPEPEPDADEFRSMDGLSPDMREAANLLSQGYSVEETAQHMSLTSAALRKRIQRQAKLS